MADRTKNKQDGIGDRIKKLRLQWGLTQRELSEIVNKSESAVRMWELGKSEPDIETINMLAKIFIVSTDQILTGNVSAYGNVTPPEEENLSEGERVLIEAFRLAPEVLEAFKQVPEDQRAHVIDLVRTTLKMQGLL